MKKLLSLFILLLLCAIPSGFAQETSKSYCMSSLGYDGSIDSLKAELLTAAKREAVREFFGEFISSFTKVENLRITEDTIQATSQGFVRIKGDPEYYQGENLGDVCVKIEAYTTEEDFEKFKPLTLTQKSCVMEGDVQTIKEDAEKKAIFEALINYDRRLEAYPPEQVLPLLREVSFSDEGFVPDTQVYCARATGIMYPVEVLGTLVAAESTTAQGKTEYTLDLTKYEVGDLPEELGRNLIIGETKKEGKYITAQTQEPLGEIELNELLLSNTFEFIMQVDWYYFSTSILLLSDNGEEIKIEFEFPNIIFGNVRKHWNPGIVGIHGVVKLVVNGKKATLFIEDELFGTAFVKPDVIYSTVIVKGLRDKDRIFGLSVRNL